MQNKYTSKNAGTKNWQRLVVVVIRHSRLHHSPAIITIDYNIQVAFNRNSVLAFFNVGFSSAAISAPQ